MLEEQLQKLGLSGKEASVYLVALEVGQGTAQELAQKTGLRRPTVYFTIEQLKKRGLMSQFEKGKKTFFAAESPENLSTFIAAEEKKMAEVRSVLDALLPELTGVFDVTGERPRVRFFEGKEGLKAMQEDFLRTKDKEIEEFFSADDYVDVFSPEERKIYIEKRTRKKISARSIYTRKTGPFPEGRPLAQTRWVPEEHFPFSSDIVMYDNNVAIASLRGKLVGVIIQSKEMADTMRAVFKLAWQAAAGYTKKN